MRSKFPPHSDRPTDRPTRVRLWGDIHYGVEFPHSLVELAAAASELRHEDYSDLFIRTHTLKGLSCRIYEHFAVFGNPVRGWHASVVNMRVEVGSPSSAGL